MMRFTADTWVTEEEEWEGDWFSETYTAELYRCPFEDSDGWFLDPDYLYPKVDETNQLVLWDMEDEPDYIFNMMRFTADVYDTFGVIVEVEIDDGGSGYSVDDVLTIVQGTNTTGTITVTGVDGSGVITSISIDDGGEDYYLEEGLSTTGGDGSDCTINITECKGYKWDMES